MSLTFELSGILGQMSIPPHFRRPSFADPFFFLLFEKSSASVFLSPTKEKHVYMIQ